MIIGDITQQEPDTDVEGSYYPGNNMGGALTGDTTNIMIYMGLCFTSLGIVFLIYYKRQSSKGL